ncbi:hypothetical protein ACOIDV_30670, partial [Klebsiella pneumoniae]
YLEEAHPAGWFKRFYLLLSTKWRCLGFCISRSSGDLSESLGKDSGTSSLASYLRWDDVGAVALVDLLYAIETA